MSAGSGRVLVGISGWRYAPWRGVFYPKKLAQKRELEFAAHALPSIEINGSFYSLQKPKNYAQWYAETPPDFVFAVKGPRFITHVLRLKEIETPIANFFASGLFELKEKLGPLLWQFPGNFRFDAERFEHFLALLPRDTDAAQALAAQHDARVEERCVLKAEHSTPLRHAIEIRNDSFIDEAFVALLREYNTALVIADTAGKFLYREDITADFTYLRLHGAEELYASGYDDASLDRWASRIGAWRSGGQPESAKLISATPPARRASRDVFCYFDNDAKVHAPFDAARLLMRLGLPQGVIEGAARGKELASSLSR